MATSPLGLALSLWNSATPVAAAPATAYAPLGFMMSQDFSLEWAAGLISDSNACVLHINVMGNGSSTAQAVPGNRGMLGKILAGNTFNVSTNDAEHLPGFNVTNDNSAGNLGGGLWRGNAGGPLASQASANHSFLGSVSHAANDARNNVYQAWTFAVWTVAATGAKQGVAALNGTQAFTFTEPGTMGSEQLGLSVARWMLNCWTTSAGPSADFFASQVFFHALTDLSGLVTGTGGSAAWVPAALKKFYDAAVGCVDFGANGSTPLGVQPLIYLNVGPAGNPEVDPLTNLGTLAGITRSAGSTTTNNAYRKPWLAALNPGETGAQIYQAWLPAFNSASIADTGSFQFENNYGQDIQIGDKLIWIVNLSYLGAAPTGFAVSSTNGAWALTTAVRSLGTTLFMTRDATSADVTANGATATAATRPTLTWTPGGGFGGGGDAKGCMMVYRRATPSATPMTMTLATVGAGTTNVGVGYNAPAITSVPAGPGVAVDVFCPFGWGNEGSNLGLVPATGMQLRFKVPGDKSLGAYAGNNPWIWDKRINFGSPTTIASRNYTGDAAGAGNPYNCFSFALT